MAIKKITIDLTRMEKASGMKRFIGDAKRDGKDVENYTCEIKLNIPEADINMLEIVIENLLTKKDSKIEVTIDDKKINQQTNQLIFYYYQIKQWPFKKRYLKKFNEDLILNQVTQEFEKLFKLGESIDIKDNLSIKVTGSINKEFKLPKFEDSKKFTEEFNQFLFEYTQRNLPFKQLYYMKYLNSLNEWRNSNDFKEGLSMKVLDKVSKKPFDYVLMNIKLLELISTFPQFLKSKEKNSIATDDQARFLIAFFKLMGFFHLDEKINLNDQVVTVDEMKKLRNDIKAFNNLNL